MRIFVDALDECGDAAPELLRYFERLVTSASNANVALLICVSCRHYPLENLIQGLEICVEDHNDHDIRMYIGEELGMSIQEEEKLISILEAVTERASGVFQWVSLVLPRVVRVKNDSLENIRRVIQKTPKDLSNLYKELLTDIDEDDLEESRRMMQWILFARRPLSLTELSFAMAVIPDTRDQYAADLRPRLESKDDMGRLVRRLSAGLAEVIEHLRHEEQIVQFIHQSVGEHLLSWEGLQLLDRSSGSESVATGRAHLQLLKTCMRLLEFMASKLELDSSATKHGQKPAPLKREDYILSLYPIIGYATASWIWHAKKVDAIQPLAQHLLDYLHWPQTRILDYWTHVYEAFNDKSAIRWYEGYESYPHKGFAAPTRETTLLHVAAGRGLTSVVEAIVVALSQSGHSADWTDSEGRTPLWWAAKNGHEKMVRLMLNERADPNHRDLADSTPLTSAADRGHEGVTRLLLEKGADPNLKDDMGRTPLRLAAAWKGGGTVRLLLEKGAHPNLKDNDGWTPLFSAANYGHEGVVRLLLENGADPNLKDIDGRTPLYLAADWGYEGVVRLLLEKGADPNLKDRDGHTPLYRAARIRHDATVKLLGPVTSDF